MSDATKAIVVIGNPLRRAGKQSNVSGYGADNAHGVGVGKSIPDDWDKSGKILDFCLSVSSKIFRVCVNLTMIYRMIVFVMLLALDLELDIFSIVSRAMFKIKELNILSVTYKIKL